MEFYTFNKQLKCVLTTPILSPVPVNETNRFGHNLNEIKAFKNLLTNLHRNGRPVRARYEVEWQTTEQSNKANEFLYHLLANKVSDLELWRQFR